TERTDDDVFLEVAELLGIDALAAGDLPDPRVVEGELFGDAVAEAVGSAVADVPDPGALGPQDQGGGSGAEAAELGVLLADRVNAGVGFPKGPAKSGEDAVLDVLEVEVGDVANGLGRSLLADGMAAHSVGDHEDVPVSQETCGVGGRLRGAGILVVAPFDAHVGQSGVQDGLECRHRTTSYGTTYPVNILRDRRAWCLPMTESRTSRRPGIVVPVDRRWAVRYGRNLRIVAPLRDR